MRAATIFGLGSREKDLDPFRRIASVQWQPGLPASPDDVDAILVFGGDGTIHRHLAQLVKLKLPVLIVPQGSGNDFARALKLRNVRDSLQAWKQFCSGTNRAISIDLGLISTVPIDAAPSLHYFCCIGSVGLDAETARRANALPRWLRGHGGYALSFPGALLGFAANKIKITSVSADDKDAFDVVWNERTTLAAFANTPVYGGGMKIAPHAAMDDGKLDLCLIRDMDRLKLFCLFPTVYFGKHLKLPQVEYLKSERLRIETEIPQDVYADGEFVCRTPIEVTPVSAALRVITVHKP